MDIRKVAKINEQSEEGKVTVSFTEVDKQKLEDLVTECSSGSCSCGSEEFLSNVESFSLSEEGKTIEIKGKVNKKEVEKVLEDWSKEI